MEEVINSRTYARFKKNFVGPTLTRKQKLAIASPMPGPKPASRKHWDPEKSDYMNKTPEQRGRIVDRVIKRKLIIKQATPSWANMDAIKEMYVAAQQLIARTGVKYEVDHIVPIQHPLVCGLHVEHNLQILTETENISKSNNFIIE